MKKNKWMKWLLYFFAIVGALTIVDESSGLLDSLFPLIILAFIIYGIKRWWDKRQQAKQADVSVNMPPLRQDLTQHYHEAGLDDQQIKFFRETMNTARVQIETLEQQMNQVAKLKAINLKTQAVKAAQGIFKELVKEPQKLHRADGFLYNHLPNLVDLTEKYITINAHDIKTANTYEALQKSAEVIEQVSSLVVKDFEQLVAEDLAEMDVEVSLAEQQLARQHEEASISQAFEKPDTASDEGEDGTDGSTYIG